MPKLQRSEQKGTFGEKGLGELGAGLPAALGTGGEQHGEVGDMQVTSRTVLGTATF